MQPIIEMKDLTFRYQEEDQIPALNKVSLNINQGEWIAIIGHNGSGKSRSQRRLMACYYLSQEVSRSMVKK